jgi:stage II sporulation protein D
MKAVKRTAILALIAAVAPASVAGASWKVEGRGFGHGVGLSQYGAFGFAEHGRSYKQILDHYYANTKLGKAGDGKVRVLLASGSGSVGFRGATRACGRQLSPDRGYAFAAARSGIELHKSGGGAITGCGDEATASARVIRIEGQGRYRGGLVATPSDDGLQVINQLGLEDYVKGVVANEVPSSWPAEALRAQAVVARSYGIATERSGSFDHYDDTRSQVYGGVVAEQASATKAVAKTKAQVVTYKGKVAQTFFYSSSGGRTESSRFGFGGGESRPYLKAVDDPFDDISPYHSWTERMSRAELQSKLGDWVDGRLRGVKVVETGDSPRIVRARVIGTRGKTAVSGFDLQGRLGLRSTWVRFKKR